VPASSRSREFFISLTSLLNKKGPLFSERAWGKEKIERLKTYLFFLAAFFFAGISDFTSSPEFL
jgi:hypothetical protein